MTSTPKISGIKACVFDAYGTLFDVHSAVGKHRERLGGLVGRLSGVSPLGTLERGYAIVRHREAGAVVPLSIVEFRRPSNDMTVAPRRAGRYRLCTCYSSSCDALTCSQISMK